LLLTLTLPRINDYMRLAQIKAIHAPEGSSLAPGAKLFDITVDLSEAVAHDCPPISHYRLALRDRAWLRRIAVARGDEVAIGAALALFSTDEQEPLDGAPARNVRISIAGILDQSGWWDGEEP